MIIPDQSHINRIREALWQPHDGCASVMVGAGFCRNARKARPGVSEFPLWHDVAKLLCTRLYPSDDSNRLRRAIDEASGTSGFLRLAQEYEVAFGRGALHDLIRQLVPDDDYVPDDMHKRLLKLPWRDVFTTNWDTLLERTRNQIVDRAYGVVRTPEEIPSAPRPRIVKLHGSFPAHIPFIFTEKDYRTYPNRFAPFVNTVQQAMMESVVLLIGFSGDDPNFLHWSGWVLDNLGESAPKIYLAGWLDLSPHRRRMLETRNVVPIDLAHHPKAAGWPEHLRHKYATEWILHTLERGRPYDVTMWPSPLVWSQAVVPDYLQPVENVTINAPVEEPNNPTAGANQGSIPEQVRAVIRTWAHNRKVYPGWLLIPPSNSYSVVRSTNEWEQAILRTLPDFPLLEKLSAIRELVWRRENLLEPLSEHLAVAVQNILDDIDCQGRRIGGTEDRSAGWADIREAWRDLAMALLTVARQRFNREVFDRHFDALSPFLNDHPDVAQRVSHEKCLWALYNLDFAALDELLKEWHPENCDPVWMARKAAILVETGHNDDAVRLLNLSLSIVREAPLGNSALASPSREGWILWLALAFEYRFLISTVEVIKAPPARRRWEQLAPLLCNASVQKRDFFDALWGDRERKDGPLFDLGACRGKAIRFSNAEYEQRVAACRAVRLSEVAGLPPSASNMVVASDILALAAERLAATDYPLASRLALRVVTSEDDATFNRVWSRSRIASMPMEEVITLVNIVTKVIDYSLPRAASAGTFSTHWASRLRVALEALSRLVLRLPPERAEEIFKRGLGYYRMEVMAKHPWLHKAIRHLLARSWEAIPKDHRAGLILDVLSAPIIGLDGFESGRADYFDPGDLLVDDEDTLAPARDPETERRWAEIVHLIVRALRTNGEARKRAALRLVPIALWDRLTSSEVALVVQALWDANQPGSDALPLGTSLYDWAFLLLPESKPGLAEQRFRGKWLGERKLGAERGFNEFFWNVGAAIVGLRKRPRPLLLTEGECARLAVIVEEWSKLPVDSTGNKLVELSLALSQECGLHEAVVGLQSILLAIDLSPSIAEALFAKVIALNQTDTPGFRLLVGVAKALPDQLGKIYMIMRMGLASNNAAIAEEAVLGLYAWHVAASDDPSRIPAPRGDLVREIGIMIATRRKGVLSRALQLARLIFVSGTVEQREVIAQLTLDGLGYLIEELRYDRDHGEEGDEEVTPDEEVPLLRCGCAHLALAMSASGYETDPTVIRWVEVAQNDPLPEVRHAKGQTSKKWG